MDLNAYRERLDQLDAELVKLFVERMEISAGIAEYKRQQKLPILDTKREREKIQSVMDMSPDDLREYTASLYSLIMELSRSSQHRLLDKETVLTGQIKSAIEQTPFLFPDNASVACQGVEGAYAQLACDKLFRHPNISYFASFGAVFSAIGLSQVCDAESAILGYAYDGFIFLRDFCHEATNDIGCVVGATIVHYDPLKCIRCLTAKAFVTSREQVSTVVGRSEDGDNRRVHFIRIDSDYLNRKSA